MEPDGPRGVATEPLRPARTVVVLAGPGAAACGGRIEREAQQAAIECLAFESQADLVAWLGGAPAFGGVAPLARAAAMAAYRCALSARGGPSDATLAAACSVACVWGPSGGSLQTPIDRPPASAARQPRGTWAQPLSTPTGLAAPSDVQLAVQTADATAGYALGGPRAAPCDPLDWPGVLAPLIERAVASVADGAGAPAVGRATGVAAAFANDLCDQLDQLAGAGWSIERCRSDAPPAWRALWRAAGGLRPPDEAAASDRVLAIGAPHMAAVEPPLALLPGSFNPLHAAHLAMHKTAAEWLSCPVDFELSLVNVDKPPLDYLEAARRAAQFAGRARLWMTTAPTFREKAALFPGATFVVGLDTMLRIGDERYYGGDRRARDGALEALARHGCRFLVFGRRLADGFRVLEEVVIPRSLALLCESVPAERFRLDLSSSEIRGAEWAGPA